MSLTDVFSGAKVTRLTVNVIEKISDNRILVADKKQCGLLEFIDETQIEKVLGYGATTIFKPTKVDENGNYIVMKISVAHLYFQSSNSIMS